MRTPRLLLEDILDAIAEIERYTPATPEAFGANPLVQSHIVRHIAIIGEAASRLPNCRRRIFLGTLIVPLNAATTSFG
jgi:uncharacterized protein with HEPN domain